MNYDAEVTGNNRTICCVCDLPVVCTACVHTVGIELP